MKNFILAIALTLISTTAFGQCFEKGKNVVELDLGLNIYPNVTNDIYLNGAQARTYKDNAGSSTVGLQYERGITNFLGLGFRINTQNYLDSADLDRVDAKSTDFALVVNGHFVRTNHVDLYASVILGATSLKIEDNRSDTEYKGSGTYSELGLGFRYCFGSGIFLGAKTGFNTANYNGNYINIFNNELKGEWNASGFRLAIGAGVVF